MVLFINQVCIEHRDKVRINHNEKKIVITAHFFFHHGETFWGSIGNARVYLHEKERRAAMRVSARYIESVKAPDAAQLLAHAIFVPFRTVYRKCCNTQISPQLWSGGGGGIGGKHVFVQNLLSNIYGVNSPLGDVGAHSRYQTHR